MEAGYYRVDVSDSVSVLTFNNEYMDVDNDTTFQADEGFEALDWLEEQLISGKGDNRKFIISGHVYPGARYHANSMWHDQFNERYFQILRDQHESVIIEIMGHEHWADLRYHSSDNVLNMEDTEQKFDFHNMFIAPGVTPNKGQNPGVAMFEITSDGIP